MKDIGHQRLPRGRAGATVTGASRGLAGPGWDCPSLRVALGRGRGGQGAQGLKCKLGTGSGSGEWAWDPALCGAARGGSSHHGQSHHAEDQHAGPEQGSLREVAAQPPDDQALEDLGEGERVAVGAARPGEGLWAAASCGTSPTCSPWGHCHQPQQAPGAGHRGGPVVPTMASTSQGRRGQQPGRSRTRACARARTHACTHAPACTHPRTCTHTQAHRHTRAHRCTHTHTYTHLRAHTRAQPATQRSEFHIQN